MFRRIRDLREDKDLTQKQMSSILNCSQQAYSNYEPGQRDIPTDILIKPAEYYKVSVDYILGITDDPIQTKSKIGSCYRVDLLFFLYSLGDIPS